MIAPAKRINLQKLAYAAIAGDLILIATGLFFGRSLQRTWPQLVNYIPVVGCALFVVVLVAVIRLKTRYRGKSVVSVVRPTVRIVFYFAMLAAFSAWTCEQIIDTPIERIHFFKYALLGLSFFFVQRPSRLPRTALTALAGGAAIGMFEEFAQRFVPTRIFDPHDILLNVTGVGAGVILGSFLALYLREET